MWNRAPSNPPLKAIYTAATAEEAELNLEAFSRKGDAQLPTISRSWRLNWERLIPFMSYPEEIRQVIVRMMPRHESFDCSSPRRCSACQHSYTAKSHPSAG